MISFNFKVNDETSLSWEKYLRTFPLSDFSPKTCNALLEVFQRCILPLKDQNKQIIIKHFYVLPEKFRQKIYAQMCLEKGYNIINPYGIDIGIRYLDDFSSLAPAIRNITYLTFDQLENIQREYIKSIWDVHLKSDNFNKITLENEHTELLIKSFCYLYSIKQNQRCT